MEFFEPLISFLNQSGPVLSLIILIKLVWLGRDVKYIKQDIKKQNQDVKYTNKNVDRLIRYFEKISNRFDRLIFPKDK